MRQINAIPVCNAMYPEHYTNASGHVTSHISPYEKRTKIPVKSKTCLLPEKMMSGRCQKPSASLTFDTSPNKLKMNKTSESISEWIV